MFTQKLQDIEAQILQLQQQQAKYQDLHAETQNALSLLTKIRAQAVELGEADAVAIAFMEALQIQPAPQEFAPQPLPEKAEDITETQVMAEIGDNSPEEEEDDEWGNEWIDNPYSTPEELADALASDDTDTVLMGIANVLDSMPAIDIEGKIWYFVQHLPMDLCDRIIPYLPKSIIPEWRKQMDVVAEEAKASIFPTEQPTTTYEPAIDDIVECISNGMVGRVTYLCDSPNGRMASVLLPGGTSNFHISNLRFITKHEEASTPEAPQEEAPASEDPENEQLAKQCLGLRSWSQIRIFADSNPAVIIRMQEIASTKAELRVINNLPSLIVGYIQRANDRTDLEWLPEPLLSEVEALLAQPQVQAIA